MWSERFVQSPQALLQAAEALDTGEPEAAPPTEDASLHSVQDLPDCSDQIVSSVDVGHPD